MARTTLYLHIGTPKTGSSAIQDFLAENTRQLQKEGYVFPDFGVRYYKVRAGRNGRWLRCLETEEERETWEKNFRTLSDLSEKYKGIILTDESLWTWSYEDEQGITAFWQKIAGRFREMDADLKVIVYLRRQDQFLYSFWGQKVKSAEKRTFRSYMEKTGEARLHLDFYSQLERIAAVVGRENIIVRTYDRSRWTGSDTIQSEFLQLCGLQINDSYVYPTGQINPSLSDSVLEAKRLLNRWPEFRDRMNYTNRYLKIAQKKLKEEGKLKNRNFFPNEERKDFLRLYDRSNEAVADKYLHLDGPLFDESDLDRPSEEAVFTSGELAEVYGIMIDALHHELEQKQQKISAMKKEQNGGKALVRKLVKKLRG
jgi:hypothetical protein